MGGYGGLAHRCCYRDKHPVSSYSQSDRDGRSSGLTAVRDLRSSKPSGLKPSRMPNMQRFVHFLYSSKNCTHQGEATSVE